jgi:uncharacterized membrane protein
LGFLDATYLTFEKLSGVVPPCTITTGCEQVLTSKFSTVFGIPDSLFGAVFYLAVFILVFVLRERFNAKWFSVLRLLTLLGFLASVGLFFIQWQILHAFCFYCLISFASSTIIFAAVLIWNRVLKTNSDVFQTTER